MGQGHEQEPWVVYHPAGASPSPFRRPSDDVIMDHIGKSATPQLEPCSQPDLPYQETQTYKLAARYGGCSNI